MMLSDVCRVHPVGGRRVRPADRLDGAYWLIGPCSAGLAQGCRCALPLQAWAGAYRGGRPPTACFFQFCIGLLHANFGSSVLNGVSHTGPARQN